MIERRVYGSVKEIPLGMLRRGFGALPYVKVALLFGSRAQGTAHRKSDYDFAIHGEGAFDWGLQAEVWADLSRILDLDMDDFDVVDLQKLDPVLRKSITENYVILKGTEYEVSRLLGKDPGNRIHREIGTGITGSLR